MIAQSVGLIHTPFGERDLAIEQCDLIEQIVSGGNGGAQGSVDFIKHPLVVAAEPCDPAGEIQSLLHHQRPHRMVFRVVGQFGDGVEERAEHAGQIIVGQLVLKGLNGGEKPLINQGTVLLAGRITEPRLQGSVHFAANILQPHACSDELRLHQHLVVRRGQMNRSSVIAWGGGIGHVVAGYLHRRLRNDDRRSTNLQCTVETHVRLRLDHALACGSPLYILARCLMPSSNSSRPHKTGTGLPL